MTYKTGVPTAICVSQLDHGDLAVGYGWHTGELPVRRSCSTCLSSCHAESLPHCCFVGFQAVFTAVVQVLMSALSLQPVSFARDTDQSSVRLHKTGVLTATQDMSHTIDYGVQLVLSPLGVRLLESEDLAVRSGALRILRSILAVLTARVEG